MRPHDQSKGKLALIDFGLVAQVEQEDMDGIISSIVHLANKDYAALVDDFIALKILPADTNRVKVCHPTHAPSHRCIPSHSPPTPTASRWCR